MATKKVYLGSIGPYLFDDTDNIDDPDGEFIGQKTQGAVSNSAFVATEFIGIPVSSISVANIDDPSSELNSLSASTVGGLIAVYQAIVGVPDPFTLYLWDMNAGSENVPYTVDGDGGTWIAVGGKYRNGDVYVSGDINYTGSLGSHHTTHENSGDDEISVTGLSGLLADDQHVLDSEVEAIITAEIVDGESIDNAIDSLIASHVSSDHETLDGSFTVVSGLQAGGIGAIGLQYKTRDITVTNGFISTIGAESGWSDL